MKHSDEVYRWATEKHYLKLAEYLRLRYRAVEFANEIQKLTGLRLAFVHDLIAWYYYGVEATEDEKLAIIAGWDTQEDAFLEKVREIRSGEK